MLDKIIDLIGIICIVRGIVTIEEGYLEGVYIIAGFGLYFYQKYIVKRS